MPGQATQVFRFADLEVHEHELRATRGGQTLEIEPKAFRVLVHLIKHAGHLVSKSELMDAVWGETAVTENSLTVPSRCYSSNEPGDQRSRVCLRGISGKNRLHVSQEPLLG